jgi:ribonuclease P protein component
LSVYNYCFDKTLRLLDSTAYKAVFDDASLKVSNQQVLFLARPNNKAGPRLGLVIAKKNAKHAVQRNRIKRIARETFRLQQHKLDSIDTIILARRGLDKIDNAALKLMFNQLWRQLQKKADKLANKTSLHPNK